MKNRLNITDLINHFRGSIVPPAENQLGAEYEIICLEKDNFSRLDYHGSPGIKELLEFMGGMPGFRRTEEDGLLTGLKHDDFTITIEPGGQLEASFSPCRTVGELEKKLSGYLRLLKETEALGIVFIAAGVDPLNSFDTVPWMPKQRYRVMRSYWEKKPGLSLYMMKQTAAIQVSIDYNSEEDAIRKIKNAITISDILSCFFGNSPVYDRSYRYTNSFRKKIWCKTDKERSGVPAGCGNPINSFADYVNYALNIPMIFLFREGRYHKLKKRVTFRGFMEEGYEGTYPDLTDWILHLNTIFSLVRFNNTTVEIRPFDSNQPDILLAITALIEGLFYNTTSYDHLMIPEELVTAARDNLPEEEAEYLAPLDNLIKGGRSPGELVYEAFRQGGINALIDRLRIG
jgi:glutamate--cysteine ligase